MEVKWAVSTGVFDRPGFLKITDALDRAGIEYFQSEYDTVSRKYKDIPYGVDECVVMYGPIQFVKNNDKGFLPGPFGYENPNTTQYMSKLPIEWFFNSESIYLPFGQIMSKIDFINKVYGDRLFIRPDSGFKSFTGFNVNIEDLEFELSSRAQTEPVFYDELCLVAKEKQILGEYRFVICDKKVVTGSQYRYDGVLDIRIDVNSDALKMAEKVAQHPWQMDTCYVVDIFLDALGAPSIGEFNSFSSSGLYSCDVDKIVKEVSACALKEWEF